jgi:hypothetical protein
MSPNQKIPLPDMDVARIRERAIHPRQGHAADAGGPRMIVGATLKSED